MHLEVTNTYTGTCGSACRCNICERRSGGKSVLKARTNQTGSLPAPGGQQNLLLEHSAQVPSSTVSPGKHDNSTKAWQAFVNGGAQADDARILKERREQEAKFRGSQAQSTGPVEANSQPPSLLQELGLDDYQMQPKPQIETKVASKGGKGKGEQTPAFNLLD
jgi:hypothetical protein